MKITVIKDDLLRGLTNVSAAINPKAIQAIMRDVLIEADESITLTGNGSDTGIQTVVEGKVNESGKVAAESNLLLNIIKKMPEGEILLESDDSSVIIKSGKSKFKIPCHNGDDFPAIPESNGDSHFVLMGDEFKNLVKQIGFASSPTSTMKSLEGITFNVCDKTLNAYALDGTRVAMRNIVIDDNIEISAIVPAQTIRKIANITSDGEVHFYLAEKYMTIEFDNTTVVMRLIENKPVDISRFTQMNNSMTVRVEREELMATLDRTTLMCKEGEKKPIVCDFSNNKINIHIVSQHGSMDEDINAEINGDGLKIGLNPRYVLEALQTIEDKIVTLHMDNSKTPLFIKDDEGTYLYLILPVSIQEA